ncbi:MAG: HAD family phosphatase [candidate division WOR-3 bacterium]|nr:MAG: HAD family phosphatase [candidate division WOR-3 bacterium]
MKKYRAIIFDCGGVIFDFHPNRVYEHWALVGGSDADSIERKFVLGETYQQFERGEIDASQFRKHISNMIELDINEAGFDDGWNSLYGDFVPGIERLLRHLAQSYRLVALTNTNEIHARKWRTMCAPVLPYFERVFSSHEMHARKPEREAYEIVLKYLILHPEEVIFLDDNPEYVSAAMRLNIDSIHVTSFGQMVEGLKNLGVEM